ncbi:MAG: DUF177 domain-containing protein [Gemmatimonadaceae bacterium]|jgi:uncharacterized protein|nr:DUF177 domain-containing protein [Gemmatimonadaceae bacterium]
MAMLCFDIRTLEARAESVDGTLDARDSVWEVGDSRPVDPGVHVSGRLSSAGQGRFYFSGRFEGSAVAECRRCLAETTVSVSDDVQLIFAQSGEDEAEEDDVVVIPAGERELDLRPAMREEWLLAVPSFALCRQDCLGLCPNCGADRNTGDCTCLPTTDPRWDALRNLR